MRFEMFGGRILGSPDGRYQDAHCNTELEAEQVRFYGARRAA